MIAVDTNILVHAHRQDAEFHAAARKEVTSLAESRVQWAIPWPCIHEFLAVVTHPRIFSPPTPLIAACDQVDAWMESPGLSVFGEDAGHWEVLREVLDASRVNGPRIHDARIAALCVRHGVTELLTADRDFSRFAGLRTRNPLVSRRDGG
jgi:uncharacterized protein